MTVTPLSIPDLLLIEPEVFTDDRGFFFESFNQEFFEKAIAGKINFVQENHSKSHYGVLRGLHYQLEPFEQGKLIKVISGEIFDVAVDIRKTHNSYGTWVGQYLSSYSKKQLWIPPGFAHGFLVMSSEAEVSYKTTNFYNLQCEKCLRHDDESLCIQWPKISNSMIISDKDRRGKSFLELSNSI